MSSTDLEKIKDHIDHLFARNRDIPQNETISRLLHGLKDEFKDELRKATTEQTTHLEQFVDKKVGELRTEMKPALEAYSTGITLKQAFFGFMKGLSLTMAGVLAWKYFVEMLGHK